MNESTVLGYVHPGEINGHFHQSVIDLLMADDARGPNRDRIIRHGGVSAVVSGPRIASARNEVVRAFLKTTAQWLLMVDSDMVFTPDKVDALFLEAHPRNRPIIGGLCFGGGRAGTMFPTLYRLKKVEHENDDPVEIIEEYPENALVKVDATGAAFLLMHRRVFEEMEKAFPGPYPWFAEGTVYRGMQFGEDWAFCMRAKHIGIPVYVHTGCEIGHIKPHILDASSWHAYKALKDEIGEDEIKAAYKRRIGAAQ